MMIVRVKEWKKHSYYFCLVLKSCVIVIQIFNTIQINKLIYLFHLRMLTIHQ